MNRFLSRWSSNWIDPKGIIFVLKKSVSTGPAGVIISNRTDSALSYAMRHVTTSSRMQVSFVYTITLKTGNLLGAGTDAKVYIRMIGDRGSTDEVMLKTSKEHLERNREDFYNFPSEDVGPLKKIIIRHDNTGFAPGWYLDWVNIRDGKGKKYNFKCDQWLTKGETYGNIVLLKEDGYVDPNPIECIREESSEEGATNNVISNDNVEPISGDFSETAQATNNDNDKQIMEDIFNDEEIFEDILETENNKSQNNALNNDNDDEILTDILKVANNLLSQNNATNDDNDEEILAESISPSTRHSTSLSPAVRNLLDTYGIDMSKIPSSGRDSRILKGDVLQYMLKENITQKKFVVSMLYPVKEKVSGKDKISKVIQPKGAVKMEKEKLGVSYTDYPTNDAKRMIDHELTMNKFEVPHLYMSTNCPVKKLDTFIKEIYKQNNFSTEETTKVILTRILSRSLLDTNSIISKNNEDIDILVTHNGVSTVIKNCAGADVDNIFEQCFNSKEIVDSFILPRYGINIIDTDGVSQLSSILRLGQVISLNVGGTKLDINTDGNVTKSMSVAISCDSRIISEVMCALLLLNCKHYLSNPNLLGL